MRLPVTDCSADAPCRKLRSDVSGRLFIAALGFVATASPARAQMPLTIEQLIVDRGRLQAVAGADYASETPFPGAMNRSAGLAVGVRYGITPVWEVNAGARRDSVSQRGPGPGQGNRRTQAFAGTTWQLMREGRFPAALLSFRGWHGSDGIGRRERGSEATATLYRSIDPVVLSLQVAMGARMVRDGHEEDTGTLAHWRIFPQLNFAVNHRITLLGGLSYSRRELAGESAAPIRYRESLALTTGVALALRQRDTVFLIGDSAPGTGGAAVQLQWFHQF